jgi:hypothetical protein
MEIPAGILSPEHYKTHTSIDVSEPGLKPLLMDGAEEILLQRIFDDAIPHITVTGGRFHHRNKRIVDPKTRHA